MMELTKSIADRVEGFGLRAGQLPRTAEQTGARGRLAEKVGPIVRKAVLGAAAAVAGGLFAGCRSTPPPTPLSQLNAQQARGHGVFQARCAVCHYDRQSGVLHGPSLLGLYKKPALPSGAAATDERVTATIVRGRNNMPALGNQLDQDDLNDLIAYLHTL
jgi:mono/diheme cytochrome c family protein